MLSSVRTGSLLAVQLASKHLTPEDVVGYDNVPFHWSLECGHLDIAKWIYSVAGHLMSKNELIAACVH
jgi:hypothetical protein